jgi:phosphoribosylanthranilate isomerase
MHTRIKICGITVPEEIEFINRMDVDYVGFVFAESKRQVTIAKAMELSSILRSDIKRVGVFVDHSVDEINDIARKAKLDIAQVHKNYTADMVSHISVPVWYAVSVKDENSIAEINRAAGYNNVAGIVSDSYVAGKSGGTGETFNWDLLSGVADEVFLILAGGLNENNIKAAIDNVEPQAVDISSGAEISIDGHSIKSEEKVRSLVRKVKGDG